MLSGSNNDSNLIPIPTDYNRQQYSYPETYLSQSKINLGSISFPVPNLNLFLTNLIPIPNLSVQLYYETDPWSRSRIFGTKPGIMWFLRYEIRGKFYGFFRKSISMRLSKHIKAFFYRIRYFFSLDRNLQIFFGILAPLPYKKN